MLEKKSEREAWRCRVQKGSSDIMKIVIMETTNERPGADVDDGFATTESELAVLSGEAAKRETLVRVAPPRLWCVWVAPPGSKRLDQNSSRAVEKFVGEAQHSQDQAVQCQNRTWE